MRFDVRVRNSVLEGDDFPSITVCRQYVTTVRLGGSPGVGTTEPAGLAASRLVRSTPLCARIPTLILKRTDFRHRPVSSPAHPVRFLQRTHGMAPFHTAVMPLEILKAGGMRDAELAKLRRTGSRFALRLQK